MKHAYQDPDARLDYRFQWSAWMQDTETITTQTVTLSPDDGMTSDGGSIVDGDVVVWLSGGTDGGVVYVTSHVETSAGRKNDMTLAVHITQR